MDDLGPEAVLPLLRGRFGRPYTWVPTCASTQALVPADAPEGAVVAADEQTAGRGRLGRRWEAPAGTSLLFSLALRPSVPSERLPELSPAAAQAVADAIAARTGIDATVKYPNDVLLRGRKVAGILGEAREGRVVLGVGVNVNVRAKELPTAGTPPTSLLLELGAPIARAALLADVLEALEHRCDEWTAALAQS
ncbi:MAG: biotin--[acetyl-CoA-carboxylase] ligase [Gaiellaceae bacterium]